MNMAFWKNRNKDQGLWLMDNEQKSKRRERTLEISIGLE
jgi:hypothetical protein